MTTGLHRLALLGAVVAFIVIVLGAYVRLSHAGLGCPDWPGCYGQLTWPVEHSEIDRANEAYPERPVEIEKAWKEMVHRYLAGLLVLLVVALNVLAWRDRPRGADSGGSDQRLLAGALLLLILFQAALGMWTVTLKLKPLVVMAHLLGGMTTFGLLLWLTWNTRSGDRNRAYIPWRPFVLVGLVLLVGQLALGGWTSANYSALACPDFPTCQGEWWPETDFGEAFVLWRSIGVDYEGGVLDLPARVAIHLSHRIGAVITLLVLGLLALRLVATPQTRPGGVLLGAALLAQVTLGILNVVLYLPLPNAVAHNGMGALLLASMLWLLHNSMMSRR